MGVLHDESSSYDQLISDVSDKHCPDSVRESAYRELERRGTNRDKARKEADDKYGDYWG